MKKIGLIMGFTRAQKKTFCTIIKDKIPSKETRSSRRDWNSTFSDIKRSSKIELSM